ncbi:MAG: TRAM domain-containing protein, partial [Acidothermus cellulolyticus]|nr:TRAM domain-containing protein [Acidothermus cellulolyticus]
EQIALEENQAQVGRVVEVLVAEGEGRKDAETHRMSGRAPDNRLVHFRATDARPGDVVTVAITQAAPHCLIADQVLGVRRTRAGDAWEARRSVRPSGVLLGMPGLRPRA